MWDTLIGVNRIDATKEEDDSYLFDLTNMGSYLLKILPSLWAAFAGISYDVSHIFLLRHFLQKVTLPVYMNLLEKEGSLGC